MTGAAAVQVQPDVAGDVALVSSTNVSSARFSGENHRPS